jgi:hypothetical protein
MLTSTQTFKRIVSVLTGSVSVTFGVVIAYSAPAGAATGTANLNKLTNGLYFFAMAACIAGMFLSAILWALGSHGQNPGQELTGRKGLIVCLTAAFFLGAMPAVINKSEQIAKHVNDTQVSTSNNNSNVIAPGCTFQQQQLNVPGCS